MSYVPVNLWVPDTTEGAATESVNLKLCDTCHSPIPEEFMADHVATQHEQTVTPQR